MPIARQATTAALLLASGAAVYALWPGSGAVPARPEPAGHAPTPLPVDVSDSVRARPNVEARPPERPAPSQAARQPGDEPALMAQLRALGTTAPERALELARVGNALFPNTPDAA